MAMGGIRGPGRRGKDRSRATAAILISATVVLAVLVGVGVVAFLNSGSSSTAQGGQLKLSNKITSQSSVGLANLGRTGQAGSSGSSATLLFAGAGGLLFTPSNGGGETVPSSQQWQADEMGGGGFVLLFSADRPVPDRGGQRQPGVRAAGALRYRPRPALVSPVRGDRLPGPRLLAAPQRVRRPLPGAGHRVGGRVGGGGTAEVRDRQAVGAAGHVLVGATPHERSWTELAGLARRRARL